MASPIDPTDSSFEDDPGWLLDLIGRIMMTHRLPPDYLVATLGMRRDDATALIDHDRQPRGNAAVQADRVRLFANILQRLEHLLGHDGPAIRRAFECPLDELSGRVPAEMLGGTIDDLWRLRAARSTRSKRPGPNGTGSVTETWRVPLVMSAVEPRCRLARPAPRKGCSTAAVVLRHHPPSCSI